MTQVTDLERKMLDNIVTNDFGEAPEHLIWADCWDCGKHGAFIERRQASGVISSLVKKDLVTAEHEGRDAILYLTDAGQALMQTTED